MRPFEFSAVLERSGVYFVRIPAKVSKAIGRRGNVPVIAHVNALAEVRASITPSGGGRHMLRLNERVRRLAHARPGDRLRLALQVDEHPAVDPMPDDLNRALRDEDALAAFRDLPPGKQNHIIEWIERAAREATREMRVAMAVEVALKRRARRRSS
jgi:hypothetical protein